MNGIEKDGSIYIHYSPFLMNHNKNLFRLWLSQPSSQCIELLTEWKVVQDYNSKDSVKTWGNRYRRTND